MVWVLLGIVVVGGAILVSVAAATWGSAGFFIGCIVQGLLAGLIWYLHSSGKEAQKKAAEEAASTKACPACAETIKVEAKKCRHCGEVLA